jgi:hypothetical protein
MAAPKGNKFWLARSKHGREKIISCPKVLWESCCEYFEWVEANPLWENKVAQFQGCVVDMPVAKMRAMTLSGLCLFLGINQETWRQWRSSEDQDFIGVLREAEEVIYNQKFAGAAADLLNANIIARDLGLTDKSQLEHSGSIDLNKMSDEELERKIAELASAGGQ